ncbi:MAG: hypothetical protein ACRCSG_00910 [Cellulosilyticaceae bacterium]
MLFDNLFFSKNIEKERKIKELEKQVVMLFKDYQIAWNSFSKEVSDDMKIPLLNKTLENSTIEECLEEMNSAEDELRKIIDSISEKIEIKKILEKIDNDDEILEKVLMREIMNYVSKALGLVLGAVVGAFVYKKLRVNIKKEVKLKRNALLNEQRVNEEINHLEVNDIIKENENQNKIRSIEIEEPMYRKIDRYVIRKTEELLEININNIIKDTEIINIQSIENLRNNEVLTFVNKSIDDMCSKVSKVIDENNQILLGVMSEVTTDIKENMNDSKYIVSMTNRVIEHAKVSYRDILNIFKKKLIMKIENEEEKIKKFKKKYIKRVEFLNNKKDLSLIKEKIKEIEMNLGKKINKVIVKETTDDSNKNLIIMIDENNNLQIGKGIENDIYIYSGKYKKYIRESVKDKINMLESIEKFFRNGKIENKIVEKEFTDIVIKEALEYNNKEDSLIEERWGIYDNSELNEERWYGYNESELSEENFNNEEYNVGEYEPGQFDYEEYAPEEESYKDDSPKNNSSKKMRKKESDIEEHSNKENSSEENSSEKNSSEKYSSKKDSSEKNSSKKVTMENNENIVENILIKNKLKLGEKIRNNIVRNFNKSIKSMIEKSIKSMIENSVYCDIDKCIEEQMNFIQKLNKEIKIQYQKFYKYIYSNIIDETKCQQIIIQSIEVNKYDNKNLCKEYVNKINKQITELIIEKSVILEEHMIEGYSLITNKEKKLKNIQKACEKIVGEELFPKENIGNELYEIVSSELENLKKLKAEKIMEKNIWRQAHRLEILERLEHERKIKNVRIKINNWAYMYDECLCTVLSATIMAVVIDAVISCWENWKLSEKINKRVEQLDDKILGLIKIMKKEISKLVKLTEEIKDGIIWADKETIIIIDKDKETIKFVEIKNK